MPYNTSDLFYPLVAAKQKNIFFVKIVVAIFNVWHSWLFAIIKVSVEDLLNDCYLFSTIGIPNYTVDSTKC